MPKYLRGRIPLDKINAIVEGFNKVLGEKYVLMNHDASKQRALSVGDKQKIQEWRQQVLEDDPRPFVTEGDLKGHLKMDPSTRNILTIIRHVGRMREVRSRGLLRYVLC